MPGLDLDSITGSYVIARMTALERIFDGREAMFDTYEKMYRMNVWKEPPKPGETRVTLPIAHQLVEKRRAMSVVRPMQITVPYTNNRPEAQNRAEKVEKWLIAASAALQLPRQVARGEFFATCLGAGGLKCTFDPHAQHDELPLVITVPSPKEMWWQMSPRGDRPVELVHAWMRSRRDIEGELGYEFPRPTGKLPHEVAAWLDEPVKYVEYWLECSHMEDAEEPKTYKAPETVADKMGRAMAKMQGMDIGPDGEIIIDGITQDGRPVESYADKAEDKAEAKGEEKKKQRRSRRIMHTIAVVDSAAATFANPMDGGAVIIKKAVYLPKGYRRIPYFIWAGRDTPLPGKDAWQSILYPLANGDGGKDALGVLAAMNLLATIDLRNGLEAPNQPMFIDDDKAQISMMPNAINKVRPGTKWGRLENDSTNPAIGRSFQLLEGMVARVGLHGVLDGQPHDNSGAAIAGMTTAHQMDLALHQADIQASLTQLANHMLDLAREFAWDDGWTAWGLDRRQNFIESKIVADDIDQTHKAVIKMSGMQPKDSMAFLSALSMLQAKKQISMEMFMRLMQQLPEFDLAADSPQEELERIIRDQMLFDPEASRQLAQQLFGELRALMIAANGGEAAGGDVAPVQGMPPGMSMAGPPGAPPSGPPPMPSGPPQGPPPGMPPGAPPGLMPGMPIQRPEPPPIPMPGGAMGPTGLPLGQAMPGGGGAPPIPVPPMR